jgi:hypothetical protein
MQAEEEQDPLIDEIAEGEREEGGAGKDEEAMQIEA